MPLFAQSKNNLCCGKLGFARSFPCFFGVILQTLRLLSQFHSWTVFQHRATSREGPVSRRESKMIKERTLGQSMWMSCADVGWRHSQHYSMSSIKSSYSDHRPRSNTCLKDSNINFIVDTPSRWDLQWAQHVYFFQFFPVCRPFLLSILRAYLNLFKPWGHRLEKIENGSL